VEGLQTGLFGPLNSSQAEALAAIELAARRFAELGHDIAALSRHARSDLTLAPQQCSLPEACQASVSLVQEFAAHQSVALGTDIAKGATVFADPRRLRQMLGELLITGIAATPASGAVHLTIKRAMDDSGIQIDLCQKLRRDTMTPAGADAAGDVEPICAENLALTRVVAELHGGTISFGEPTDSGCAITIQLPDCQRPCGVQQPQPYNRVDAATAGAAAEPAAAADATAVILVADDEPDMRQAISNLLEALNYRVHTAANGQEAVRVAAEILPHLLILDMHMPVMSGADVIRHLRSSQEPALQRMPIITLSGQDSASEGDRCLSLGATAYLSKPCRSADLTRVIGSLLKQS
jgi:CheY-like chemotaxis protein